MHVQTVAAVVMQFVRKRHRQQVDERRAVPLPAIRVHRCLGVAGGHAERKADQVVGGRQVRRRAGDQRRPRAGAGKALRLAVRRMPGPSDRHARRRVV